MGGSLEISIFGRLRNRTLQNRIRPVSDLSRPLLKAVNYYISNSETVLDVNNYVAFGIHPTVTLKVTYFK